MHANHPGATRGPDQRAAKAVCASTDDGDGGAPSDQRAAKAFCPSTDDGGGDAPPPAEPDLAVRSPIASSRSGAAAAERRGRWPDQRAVKGPRPSTDDEGGDVP